MQHVGHNIEPRNQVELLEDHGAVTAASCGNSRPVSVETGTSVMGNHAAADAVSRLIILSSVDLPAPEATDDADHADPPEWTMDTESTAMLVPKRRVTSVNSKHKQIPLDHAGFRDVRGLD